MTTTRDTHYIVKSSAARMPAKCWGRYRRVAVLRVDSHRLHVSMISTHARGVHEIMDTWERRHVGKTERCAFERALCEAQDLADRLNGPAQ